MVIYIHQTSAVALFLFKLPTKKKIQDEVQTSKYLVCIGGRLLTQALPQGSALYLQCVTALYKSRGHSLGTSPAGCSTPLLCLPKKKRAWGGEILHEKASFPISKYYNL